MKNKIIGKLKIYKQMYRNNSDNNKTKNREKGSTTLFVLITMMFMLTVTSASYFGFQGKIVNQNKEILKIEEEYKKADINEVYDETLDNLGNQIYIALYRLSGEIYTNDYWINESVRLKIYYPNDLKEEDKYYYINGEKRKYSENEIIENNCKISAEYKSTEKQVDIAKIDKEKPEINISQNGGNHVIPTQKDTATVKTSIRIEDRLSKIKEAKYAWSRSDTIEPTTWENATKDNVTEIIKTDCIQGNYYLWMKAIDNAGNEEKKISNVFIVKGKEESNAMITLTKDKTTWTNENVTVSAVYNTILTQSKTLTCTGTLNTDYTVNGTTNVIVKTNEKTVTATATDIAGNKIIKSLTINNIDKTPPTVSFSPNGNTTYAKSTSTAINVSDNSNSLTTLRGRWMQGTTKLTQLSDFTGAGGWSFVNGETTSASSVSGDWYLWIYAQDEAGNERITNTNVFKLDNTVPPVPTVKYNGGANSCSWKNNYNLTLTSSDAHSGVSYYEIDKTGDGNSNQTTGSNFIPSNGWSSCNVRFRAVDKVGNRSEWTTSHHIHMDTEPPKVPTVKYNSGANSCSWKNNYNITVSATDNIGIAFYEIDWENNGIVNTSTQGNFIPWNGYSSCNTRFRSVDHAGNRSEWTTSHHIHMDTAKPTITQFSATPNGDYTSKVSLRGTDTGGSGLKQCHVWASGYDKWHTFTGSLDLTLSENKTYYVVIYDNAGNASIQSQVTTEVYNYNVDNTKWTNTLSSAVSMAGNGSTIKLVRNITDNTDASINKNLTINVNGKNLYRGGVISVNGGSVTITSSGGTIYANNANKNAILVSGGTAYITGSLSIRDNINNRSSSNALVGSKGGTTYIRNNNGTITSSCNTVATDGGTIQIDSMPNGVIDSSNPEGTAVWCKKGTIYIKAVTINHGGAAGYAVNNASGQTIQTSDGARINGYVYNAGILKFLNNTTVYQGSADQVAVLTNVGSRTSIGPGVLIQNNSSRGTYKNIGETYLQGGTIQNLTGGTAVWNEGSFHKQSGNIYGGHNL